MKPDFTLDDLRESLRHLIQNWVSEFVVAGGHPKEVSRFVELVGALSPEERRDPDRIGPARLKELAAKYGLSESRVAAILTQFKRMREVLCRHYDASMRHLRDWSTKVDESWDLG